MSENAFYVSYALCDNPAPGGSPGGETAGEGPWSSQGAGSACSSLL